MIKKLSLIALLTGLGQLLSLIAVSIIAKNLSLEKIGQVASIESTIFLITSIVSFGLQLAVNRKVAITENWKRIIVNGQKARISMGILLMFVSLMYFITSDFVYLLFLGAPIIAMNSDYALYGVGKAEYAAMLSFIRVAIPSSVLIICALYAGDWIVGIYPVSLIAGILLVSIFSANKLKISIFEFPAIIHLKQYLLSLPIGIASVSLTIMTSGVIFFATLFYSVKDVGIAFLGIKLYLIFRGIKRIIIQAFFRELKDDNWTLIIDRLCILASISFGGSLLFYPETINLILFSSQDESIKTILPIIALIVFITSLTNTAGTKMLLLEMDEKYFLTYFTGAIGVILTLFIAKMLGLNFLGILLAIIVGELIIFILFTRYLGFKQYTLNRIVDFLKNLPLLIILLIPMVILGDSLEGLIVGVIILFIITFFINQKLLLSGNV